MLLAVVCCENGTGAERAFLLCLQLLENLVVAMESEAQVIDISRVSGFMQKVRAVWRPLNHALTLWNQVRNGVI